MRGFPPYFLFLELFYFKCVLIIRNQILQEKSMKKNQLVYIFVISIMFLAFLSQANAQNLPNQNVDTKSYSVYTYVIIGSKNSTEKPSISNEISKPLEDIKREFGFTNFQIVSTQFQSIKVNGAVSYTTIIKGQKSDVGAERSIFTTLNLKGFYNSNSAKQESYGFGSFSFQARFPYVSETLSDGNKKTEVINYERIGISSEDIEIMLNQPTLISSLPVGDQAFFFVVKIKSNN